MTLKNLSFAFVTLFLISCGSDSAGPKALTKKVEKRGKTAVRPAGSLEAPETVKPQASSWGRVFIDDQTQSGQIEFQQQVASLLEPQFSADEVGVVNGIDDSNLPEEQRALSGIAFWGKGLSLGGGGLDPDKSYDEQVSVFDESSASLRLSIYSAEIISDTASEQKIQEIPLHFNDGSGEDSGKLVDSIIIGKRVQLIFADAYGVVSLDGEFDSDNFQGKVYFKTNNLDTNNDGELEAVERNVELLGEFSVSTCGFFTCIE